MGEIAMKMQRNIIITALSLAGLLSQSALADKPEWAGKHGRGKGEQTQQQDAGRQDYRNGDAQLNISLSFSSHDRQILSDYYQSQQRAGHCPPGLAKKNAQCMPPGQLKNGSAVRRCRAICVTTNYHRIFIAVWHRCRLAIAMSRLPVMY